LLFFQTLLLGGYAYAHFSTTYLKPRRQVILHLALLGLSAALLPITPSESWRVQVDADPNWQILLLLTVTIGLPYFVLSSTGPLMQQWFSQTSPGVSPYRLYALSNVGSLLALLSYPAFFEVKFSRQAQANLWSAGLLVFVLFCAFCAYLLWRRSDPAVAGVSRSKAPDSPESTVPEDAPAARAEPTATGSASVGSPEPGVEEPSPTDKLLWVALPMVASVLLLATTNKLCQEVAVIPFLWVLPLSLYLLSFIICFDHARWYHRGGFIGLLLLGMALVAQVIPAGTDVPMRLQIAVYTVTLFIACMVCHGELYRLKPLPRRLTAYFLYISFGGALGGFLVAIAAPAIFKDYRELQLGFWLLSYLLGVLGFRHRSREITLAAAVGALAVTVVLPWLRSYFDDSNGVGEEYLTFFKDRALYIIVGVLLLVVCTFDFRRLRPLTEWQPRMAGFVMALSVALGAVFVMGWGDRDRNTLSASRNFYGTLKVLNYSEDEEEDHYHLLLHGATTHGIQFVKPEKAVIPTTYYSESSGVGLAINQLPQSSRRIGLVGLGTGTLAAYARKGDVLRIYEINPAVETLAREHFKYLDYSQGKVDVVMGDARLMMERELADGKPQEFDLLALDAFSSDAIPVHLLTREAFAVYLQHLKPDGVLAIHISNRYLDLRPVVEKLAQTFGLGVTTISDDNEPNWWVYATTWMLVSRNRGFLETEAIREVADAPGNHPNAPLWTDDFASLYSIMK
jgi:spermidine synthase